MKNIHIIQTDKPSRLAFDLDENFYLTSEETQLFEFQNLVQNRELYITSDEEIKGYGEVVFDIRNNKVVKWEHPIASITPYFKKIILSTDEILIKDGVQAIPDEFLEWFVKNPSCERVEIRYTVDFNSKAVIIIPKEEQKQLREKLFNVIDMIRNEEIEPKQETLEEFTKESFKSRLEEHLSVDYNDGVKLGAKWQQERMYSEEEVYKLTSKAFLVKSNNETLLEDFDKWFKQYKKK